ncbi:MAG: hypothetical protein KAS98_15045 [Deltaproteobacteria bacterium]|nr:hypothetical protein [Deltaproteobacteria bacterium]
MVKKVFTLFLVSCFLLNTVFLNALTANTPLNSISGSELVDFTNKPSGFIPFLDYGKKEELINTINEFLDILEDLDTSDKPYINELMQIYFGDSSANEFREIINRNLQECVTYEINQNDEVAAGCLAPYSLSLIQIWVLAPISMLYSLVSALRTDNACSLMYGFWSLTFLTMGFGTRTTYRICAEEKSDSPNQDTIDKLEEDKAVMTAATFVFFLIAITYAQYCDWSSYGSYDD